MKNICKILLILCTTIGCQNINRQPIVPAISLSQPQKHELDVIGGVEPIYLLPMKTPFSARIDTGAETSSLDVSNIKSFERDGQKWVSFDIVNDQCKEKHHFEKPVTRVVKIKRINGGEKRFAVKMNVKFGNKILFPTFTLADREKFEYQALIGRNILNGQMIVNPSIENTLH